MKDQRRDQAQSDNCRNNRKELHTRSSRTARNPIDEEDDVPGFLAHQHVENLEKPFGQETGPAGDLEHAKTEKRVEAFAVAKIGKGPAEMRAERLVERTLFGRDAVSPYHLAQQLGVT